MKVKPILNSSKEVASILAANHALLVHCASYKKLAGTTVNIHDPLARLECAITNRCNVACSTLIKGDKYPGNLTGPLGIIIDPGVLGNVTNICHTDAGTMPDGCKGRSTGLCQYGGTGSHISDMTLVDAIKNRVPQGYNEICAHSYDVIGLVACAPLPLTYPAQDNRSEEDRYFEPRNPIDNCFQLEDVRKRFPSVPIYIWKSESGLHTYEIDYESGQLCEGSAVTCAELYEV